MIKAILKLKDGQVLGNTLVPPMTPMPEIINWGQRVFIYSHTNVDKEAHYTEGLMFVVQKVDLS